MLLFACAKKHKFAKIPSEMKKILIFIANLLLYIGVSDAAVRDGTTISRTNVTTKNQTTQSRLSTTVPRATTRTNVLTTRSAKTVTPRETTKQKTRNAVTARTATPVSGRGVSVNTSRAGTTTAITSTRTGAEYEQCKNTYFSCMDQFCTLKNDDYRRCSCNDRVFELSALRDTLQSAGEQITIFNENLDVVGMTAAQASAMRTESEGEAALTSDKSASKALLQAIMNSIRGEDATVGGKYTDLNSIHISFDTANAFGMTDVGQAIASYNGVALYNAVYPQCRDAVRADCNDASLQRAITAYLMAIEQDCNTVQSAIEKTQSQMKSAVRESSAMLDLARIENRQQHNSSDLPTCITDIENAILSEQVCGANYHKCLDNGEYVDITTGKPITGVTDFFKLGTLLTFNKDIDATDQKLAQNPSNRTFVQNFEKRVKKFASDAMDKCVEDADLAWSTYLDRAMLAIYYAQQSKVSEIKQTCFDYISTCYGETDTAIDAAISGLTNDASIVLQPDKIALNSQICNDYIESCNNMFDGDIIQQYIAQIQQQDTITACRAIAKQCFDKYGGTNYENFYYPYSGLFETGAAPDWFTLYEYDEGGNKIPGYKSECAKQLASIDACNKQEIIEEAFGGFDKYNHIFKIDFNGGYPMHCIATDETDNENTQHIYGLLSDSTIEVANDTGECKKDNNYPTLINNREMRSTGVASEVYNTINDILSTQCTNIDGSFISPEYIYSVTYDDNNPCLLATTDTTPPQRVTSSVGSGNIIATTETKSLWDILYGLGKNENICPRNYGLTVDTASWGICSCWNNGGRRSKWGTTTKCIKSLPVETVSKSDEDCNDEHKITQSITGNTDKWCTQQTISGKNQVCPLGFSTDAETGYCSKKIKNFDKATCMMAGGTWESNACSIEQLNENTCTNAGGTWESENNACTLILKDLPYGND